MKQRPLLYLLYACALVCAVQDWLYTPDLVSAQPYLKNTSISGVQLLYAWDQLEPSRNCYNFTQIIHDLEQLSFLPRPLPLWLQLQTALSTHCTIQYLPT
jgi:hypothetical protein